jgi:sterol desaturase/sphingolipid hydroxylase (fatty acid hydroxylase superfamily)
MNYVVLAIPVFFLLIGLELVITRIQEKDYYTLSDSVADLGCGLVSQLVEVALKTFLFAGYLFLYAQRRLFEIPAHSVAAWAGCLLGVDFLYYWFHRKSHEVNAFWAAHVVHHSSEEYNLAVALRQGAFQGAFSWVFYLPLAVIGFPPLHVPGRLVHRHAVPVLDPHARDREAGPLEWILNTPSNHRVHHGRNPKYIDRNHAGMLIIWDRMFGTYVEEQEEPVYGITTPLRSWNPVWANLHYWVDLFGKARRAARPVDKVRLFLARPGWHPEDLGGFQAPPEVDAARAEKFATPAPSGLKVYAFVQFAITMAVGSVFHVPAGIVAAVHAMDDGRLHRGRPRPPWEGCSSTALGRAPGGRAPRRRRSPRPLRRHPRRLVDARRDHRRRRARRVRLAVGTSRAARPRGRWPRRLSAAGPRRPFPAGRRHG